MKREKKTGRTGQGEPWTQLWESGARPVGPCRAASVCWRTKYIRHKQPGSKPLFMCSAVTLRLCLNTGTDSETVAAAGCELTALLAAALRGSSERHAAMAAKIPSYKLFFSSSRHMIIIVCGIILWGCYWIMLNDVKVIWNSNLSVHKQSFIGTQTCSSACVLRLLCATTAELNIWDRDHVANQA